MAEGRTEHQRGTSLVNDTICGRHLPFLSAALAIGALGLKVGIAQAMAMAISACLLLALVFYAAKWCAVEDAPRGLRKEHPDVRDTALVHRLSSAFAGLTDAR